MEIVKLTPAEKDNLWGGKRLKEKYGKHTSLDPLAETWELAFHKDGKCKTPDGRTLEEAASPQDLGENACMFPYFPTLIKFIDAREDLSVQVHPSDSYALQNEDSYGKTEMWYIVEAEEGAGIYLGFSRDVTASEFEDAIRSNTLTALLNFYPVHAGESYFIPSGTIHAIGKGCLIAEIQQNSNLTYRVYDWGRTDKNGKGRELHIDKAKKVTSLSKFVKHDLQIACEDGDLIGASRYFTVKKIALQGERDLFVDNKSFRALTCTAGEGTLGTLSFRAGDTLFVPAGHGVLTLSGNATLLMTELRRYYIGIDLGGTFIKGGIVDDLGRILLSDKCPTGVAEGPDAIVRNMEALATRLIRDAGLSPSDIEGVGVGVPGMIDREAGVAVYSGNLGFRNFPIAEAVRAKLSLPVIIENDANAAALGETRFGSGKGMKNVILITLGTGVGGGIVLNGALYSGARGAGAELGHMSVLADGEPCKCGRRGCLEVYASATALIRMTRLAMEKDKDSLLWSLAKAPEDVDGTTAFRLKDQDKTARAVVDEYLKMLGVGLTNLANIFRPDAILLGGGISAEGKSITEPLQAYVDAHIYATDRGPRVLIECASLGNRAGLVGAAALCMKDSKKL